MKFVKKSLDIEDMFVATYDLSKSDGQVTVHLRAENDDGDVAEVELDMYVDADFKPQDQKPPLPPGGKPGEEKEGYFNPLFDSPELLPAKVLIILALLAFYLVPLGYTIKKKKFDS